MSLKLLIDRAFGHAGREVSGGEIMYDCPSCNHHKPKLSVNIETGFWKCWICGHSHNTRGKAITTLFKFLKVPPRFYDELKRYKIVRHDFKVEKSDVAVRLPEEFKSLLYSHHDFEYNHAMHYLKKRGITPAEILRYNIGYCNEGEYSGRIILPSYDKNGHLNYFMARAWHKDSTMKYKNPPMSKDVVGLELFADYSQPLILVEGLFDAIAIRRNAIPLFGKNLPNALKMAIVENQVTDVYIVLDSDALANVMQNAEFLQSYGVNVHTVTLAEKDPSEMGFTRIWDLINKTGEFSFSDLINMKLALN